MTGLGPGPIYAAMDLLKTITQELKEKAAYETMLVGTTMFDDLKRLIPSLARSHANRPETSR